MKLKKALALAISACLFATCFMTGCAEKPEATSDATSTSTETEQTEEPLKICLLLTGNLGDMSFLDSGNAGVEEIAATYGAETKVIEMGSDSTKYEPNLLDASDAGYDIIIGSGWQMQEPIEAVAPDYPDVKYIIFDGSVAYDAADYSNVYSIIYRQNEASYLAGVMAAMMTETDYIGFLGGAEGAGIDDFAVGYIEGAQSVNPDIKVSVGYVGSFADAAKCKEMALAQYNQGADMIFTAAGASGLGTLDAAKDMGLYAIGVDSDQALIYEESDIDKANCIPTSVMKKVNVSLVRAIDLHLKGELGWGAPESLGLAEDSVCLSENDFYMSIVPEEVRTAIDEAAASIIAGDITVSSAYEMTTEETSVILNSAK